MRPGGTLQEHQDRIERLRRHMGHAGVDAVLIGIGPDLEYFSGYRALPLERLTMLVVSRDGLSTMVLPVLEAPHFHAIEGTTQARAWEETEDPVRIVAELLSDAGSVAVSDETWARFVVDLLMVRSGLQLSRATHLTAPLRMRKSQAECSALQEVGRCVDDVHRAVQEGEVALVGRTERDVAREIAARLGDAGHESVEFTIVASGPNAASPHHEPGDRVIERDEVVLFDIGGRWSGYFSDSTRCVVTGTPDPAMAEAYAVLQAAQAAGVQAARVGNTCQEVDRITRGVLVDAGYGDQFIHRTGHGIGLAGHEEPYIVEGNDLPLEPGFAFSVEPGIYVPGEWGLRIEDIVIVTDGDPVMCNQTTTELVSV